MDQSTRVSDGFNPYHQWLGIPSSEHPPHHYRLLGLAPFEDNFEVISNAADRQMGHVKSFASGPQAAESQALLNELSKARLCLLNATRKAEYDEWLAEQLYASERSTDDGLDASDDYDAREAFDSFAPVGEMAPSIAAPVSPVLKRRKRRKSSGMGAALGVFVVGGGLVVGLLWYAAQQRPVVADVSPVADNQIPPSGPASPPAAARESPSVSPRPTLPEQRTAPSPRTGFPPQGRPAPREEQTPPRQSPPPRPISPSLNPQPEPSATVPDRSAVNPRVPSTRRIATAGLFAALPTAVELPGEGAHAAELAEWRIESYQLAEVELELLTPDFVNRGGPGLYLHPHVKQENTAAWLLLDAGEVDPLAAEQQGAELAEQALASVRVANGALAFEWAPSVTDPERRDRVRMGVVRFRHRGTTHDMQLRVPLVDSGPVVLGNWTEIFEHRIDEADLSPLPPMANVAMRIEFLKEWPTMNPAQGDPDGLKESEQLMVQFTSDDYAGVGANWKTKGKKLAISIAPGFTLESTPGIEVLSRGNVQSVEQRLINQRRKAEQEYNKRVGNRGRLQRNLQTARSLNIQLPGGGTTQQLRAMKQAGINKANQTIAGNEARISYLRDLGNVIDDDLQSRIPSLRQLATQLEGNAAIGFELYYSVGDTKVVLFEKGLAEQEELEGAAEEGWSAFD